MPLIDSDTPAATKDNFEEFGKGPTYAKTTKKFGKAKANKQRIAVVLSNKRKAAGQPEKMGSVKSKPMPMKKG